MSIYDIITDINYLKHITTTTTIIIIFTVTYLMYLF